MLEIIISVCLGIGLSASAGFRVFVPLLLLSISGYLGWIPLNEDWQWAGSLTAIIVLAVASVIELGAYFIPYVDNLLDTVSIPLATVAGTLVMFTVLSDVDPIYSWTLAIIAGGGTAASIATTTSAARATSTTVTAGIANPIISILEAIFSTFLSILSILAPFLAVIVVILTFFGIRKLYRKMFKKSPLSRKRNNPTTIEQ
ncbi:protein of unknown function [Nonlabens sp. Hel1_33_55]|uniref:DUF4126 domain-containing protein n=1 Tax=Nonlabens sp. Hel1_33_55 TaxID=1336802 RepID=UPI000875C6B9|nr:DUF4126 domain-containing protein [Nonlabens sp. Hel1_33_55]SCX96182.1 protein of unknown function [Nonlabens sp. Hel1_33_55]